MRLQNGVICNYDPANLSNDIRPPEPPKIADKLTFRTALTPRRPLQWRSVPSSSDSAADPHLDQGFGNSDARVGRGDEHRVLH